MKDARINILREELAREKRRNAQLSRRLAAASFNNLANRPIDAMLAQTADARLFAKLKELESEVFSLSKVFQRLRQFSLFTEAGWQGDLASLQRDVWFACAAALNLANENEGLDGILNRCASLMVKVAALPADLQVWFAIAQDLHNYFQKAAACVAIVAKLREMPQKGRGLAAFEPTGPEGEFLRRLASCQKAAIDIERQIRERRKQLRHMVAMTLACCTVESDLGKFAMEKPEPSGGLAKWIAG